MCALRNDSAMSISSMQHASPSDKSLISKRCAHINLAAKRSMTPAECRDTINWIKETLNYHDDDKTLVELLNALNVMLKIGNSSVSDMYSSVFGQTGSLSKLLQNISSLNVVHSLLKCIYSITSTLENYVSTTPNVLSTDYLDYFASIIVSYLFKKKQKDDDEILYYETIIYACKILQTLYMFDEELNKHHSETIGACKHWMLHGLEDDSKTLPSKAIPSQQTVPNINYSNPKKGGKRIKLRKPRNVKSIDGFEGDPSNTNIEKSGYKSPNIDNEKLIRNSPVVTSESDFSDSENSIQCKLNTTKNKVRLAALNLLHIIIQTSEKHIAFSYWWTFLPDLQSNSQYKCGGLEICITQEPTSAGRRAAFIVLLSLLTSSRSYLMQSDTSKHLTVSFTPFSVALGISIENIHIILCNQLTKEHSIPILIVILKCIAATVQATPYHKLGVNLLLRIVKCIRSLFLHKDWTLQVQSLIVMGCIISTSPSFNELSEYLQNNTSEIIDDTKNISLNEPAKAVSLPEEGCSKFKPAAKKSISWLIEICFNNLGWILENDDLKSYNQSVVPTRLESLQVLSFISLQYFDDLIAPNINLVQKVLCSSLDDGSTEICLHAAKCIGSIGDAMSKTVQNHNKNDFVTFWTNTLHSGLTKLIQNELHTPARAVACDCIGTIGETIFINLEDNLRILAATLLLGCCADEDALVRAAAVRALAVSIMYQQWREDICLVSDCSEMALRIIAEDSPSVKLKASWALANITDALLLNKSNPEMETIDKNLFFRLMNASLQVSNENDKIKVNAMRAIGNLLYMLDPTHFDENDECQNIVHAAVEKLKQSSTHGNMKVRWNACHSLGKSLKNETLYMYLNKWQESVLECLCSLIQSCKNLKVCNHACTALCSLTSRQQYGSNFIHIWEVILKILNNSSNHEDFQEYQHKDSLIQQLCITLSHLTCLLNEDDLVKIFSFLCFYWETAAQSIQHVAERSEPQSETCYKILEAAKFVTSELHPTNEKQQQSVTMLQNMFIIELN